MAATCGRRTLRLPVELGGAVTLIPLHSATASALFTSLLSLHNQSWGCLSEEQPETNAFPLSEEEMVVILSNEGDGPKESKMRRKAKQAVSIGGPTKSVK
ncbi:hypothetical protein V6N11_067509 [Hibiscus sabdariffa]|uniref:Uncharacterized protein n=1 Tax=Hibiscus sabdariffa TaxID=183260 RepID=A0ABR2SR42_9ROSI